MNSERQQDAALEKQETSAMGRFQAVEFTLTLDQFTIIQHFLPKGFVLVERKSMKRQKGSSHKLIDPEMSRFSGGYDNTDELQGRSKRARTKKIDRYLQEDLPRPVKRIATEKLSLDDELSQCAKILNQLKKHPNATPFLEPVDPKKSGASHYFDIIKDPMDFSTIQRNLKLGEYHTATQFHADINKIWYNSYAYNEKSSKIYKITVDMQKYYKKLLSQGSSAKRASHPKQKSKAGTDKNKIVDEHNDNSKAEDLQNDDQIMQSEGRSNRNSSRNNQYDV